MDKLKILVVGTGMYVTGRNKTGVGTIFSSIAQISKEIPVELIVVARSESGKQDVIDSLNRINSTINSDLKAEYLALGDNYLESLENICKSKNIDCAIVSVPDHLHFEYTKKLMKHNVHCLVVKPFTPTLKEAEELVELQLAKKLHGAVEFHKRWDETNLFIKKALTEKRIGKILYFTVDYSQKISIPLDTFKEWSNKSNIFQYLGVHYVDLIYFLTGYKPVKLTAIGTDGILKQKRLNTFDSVHASIIWQNPLNNEDWFISNFNTNWIDPNCTSAMSDQKYKVIGTLGRIECDQKNRGVELVTDQTGIQQINPYFSDYLPDENGNLKFEGYGYKSIRTFILDIIDIKNKKVTPEIFYDTRPSFKQSLVSTAVIEAVNYSLKNEAIWVKVE